MLGRSFCLVQSSKFLPSSASVCSVKSNSSLRLFFCLCCFHGSFLSLSLPGLLQSGQAGRNELQQACPASLFGYQSGVCSSECGAGSLSPLCTENFRSLWSLFFCQLTAAPTNSTFLLFSFNYLQVWLIIISSHCCCCSKGIEILCIVVSHISCRKSDKLDL